MWKKMHEYEGHPDKEKNARRLPHLKCTPSTRARDNKYLLKSRFAKLAFFVSPLTRYRGSSPSLTIYSKCEGFSPFLFFSPFEHNPLSLHPQSTSQIVAGGEHSGKPLLRYLAELCSPHGLFGASRVPWVTPQPPSFHAANRSRARRSSQAVRGGADHGPGLRAPDASAEGEGEGIVGERAGRGGERLSKPPPLPNPGEPSGLHANPPLHAPRCIKKGWGTQPQLQSEAARKDLRRMESVQPSPTPPYDPQPGIGSSVTPTPHLPGPGRLWQPLWARSRPPPSPSLSAPCT